jgi:hypothetical protein
MKYKFHKEYFLDNDNDAVECFGKTISIGFNSNTGNRLSDKLLSILYGAGKPYVSLIGDEVEEVAPPTPKPKAKTKKKKVKIDEPKAEEPTSTITEPNEEES